MNLKNTLAPVAVVLALTISASAAFAGYTQNMTVTVYSGSSGSGATGAVSAARYSSDSGEYIGCSTYNQSNRPNSANCFAQDANGRYAGCYTSIASLVLIAATVNASSDITFGAAPDGTCTIIQVENWSGNIH
jgi:hypothetical protein